MFRLYSSLRTDRQAKNILIPALDHFGLTATFYPAVFNKEKSKHVVIISPATGVRQSFYENYARYLAQNGCHAIT